jgi:hypothetical protein
VSLPEWDGNVCPVQILLSRVGPASTSQETLVHNFCRMESHLNLKLRLELQQCYVLSVEIASAANSIRNRDLRERIRELVDGRTRNEALVPKKSQRRHYPNSAASYEPLKDRRWNQDCAELRMPVSKALEMPSMRCSSSTILIVAITGAAACSMAFS